MNWFYWDNDWKSLGKQVAQTNVLHYDKGAFTCAVPGKEPDQRQTGKNFFTYEHDTQIWW